MSEGRQQLLAAIEAAVTDTLDRQLPDLVDELAEQVAERAAAKLAERIGELPAREPSLIDVAEVARRFGVSRDYVYEHSDELGALRLGSGRNPRLRFDPSKVEQALTAKRSEVEPEPPRRRPRRRSRRAELLPIGGDES